ncbi:MAG: hypothetical protein J6N76_10405 [Lachnospiraceae bacterium]|nr:hypothetical protein [Lachnospiraceae bacterium]
MAYDRDIVENLKLELSRIEEELQRAKSEVDRLNVRKKTILDELANHTDERYEEEMLTRVYNQRRRQG